MSEAAVTKGGIRALAKRYLNLQNRTERLKEKGEQAATMLLQTVEVSGGAAAAAMINAKLGKGREYTIAGLPVDVTTGVALQMGALFGVFGKQASHVSNVADGFLAAFAYRSAFAWGMGGKAATGYAPAAALGYDTTGYAPASAYGYGGESTGYAPAGAYNDGGTYYARDAAE